MPFSALQLKVSKRRMRCMFREVGVGWLMRYEVLAGTVELPPGSLVLCSLVVRVSYTRMTIPTRLPTNTK